VTPRFWSAAAAIPVALAGTMTAASPASAIVGGTDATRDYAFAVDVQREHADGSFSLTCGGSVFRYKGLIGVATGAHCVTDPTGTALPAKQIRLSVNSTIRDAGRIVTVTSIGVPTGWDWGAPGPDGPDQVTDWAVLTPSDTRGLHPIDITHSNDPRLRLIGWGATKTSGEGPLPDMLQQLDGNTITDTCTDPIFSTGEICVDSPPGTGPCYGDSGSAALVRDHGALRLRGITSRIVDQTCGTSQSVYTDARHFRHDIGRMLLHGPTPRHTRKAALDGAHYDLWPTFTNPMK
jgi:trypsin